MVPEPLWKRVVECVGDIVWLIWIAPWWLVVVILGALQVPVFFIGARPIGVVNTWQWTKLIGYRRRIPWVPVFEFEARPWLGDMMDDSRIQAFAWFNLVVYLSRDAAPGVRLHEHVHVWQQVTASPILYGLCYLFEIILIWIWKPHQPETTRLHWPVAEQMAYNLQEHAANRVFYSDEGDELTTAYLIGFERGKDSGMMRERSRNDNGDDLDKP